MQNLAPPDRAVGQNLSAEFQALMRITGAPQTLFRELQNFKILIVPGFKNSSMAKSSGDFVDQTNELRAGGLVEDTDFHIMSKVDGFNGLQEIRLNSAAIAKAISTSNRPVILVSQSKGSADVLEALLNHPEIQSHVHAWFSIQGAFWGSQIADGIEAKPRDRFFFHQAMKFLGGGAQTIIELQKSARLKYMREHAVAISQLSKTIHVISFASHKDPAHIWWALQKLDNGYFSAVQSVISDGVIQVPDALLPQSNYIVVENVDHADSTLQAADKDRKKNDAPGFNRHQFMLAIAALTLP